MLTFRMIVPDVVGVVARLGKLPGYQRNRMMNRINRFLLSVLRDSKELPPRVPVDTGALQSSGFTEPCELDGGTITASIGYGGADSGVDYAVYVHENLNPAVRWNRPGSGPKFLSTHLDARTPELQAGLQQDLADGALDLFS